MVNRVGSWVLRIGVKSDKKEDSIVADFEIVDRFFDLDFICCIKSWKIREIGYVLSIEYFEDIDEGDWIEVGEVPKSLIVFLN